MNRNALGIIAAFLLLIGGVTAVSGPAGSSAAGFAGGCIRVGLVLGAVWLALPQIRALLTRLPRSIFGWFFGKSKDPPRTDSSPVERRPRPRRRSRA
jgi:hypothetical protein